MKSIRVLLKYVAPFKWQVFKNILYNVLSAFFALFVLTLVEPFLRILFNDTGGVPNMASVNINLSSIGKLRDIFLMNFISHHGKINTLLLVSVVVIITSLFKNGFIFLASNCMAYMRAGTVRNLRKKMYDKILRLPLSYFSDARKGDVMTRISNDVQEIELSVMSSLTIIFKDPLYILIFIIYLMVTSFQLTLFAVVMMPLAGWLIGKTSKTLKAASFAGQQSLGSLLSSVEETLTGLRIVKGFNAEKKMQAQFGEINEKYSKIFRRVARKAYLASPLSEFLATIVVMILMYIGGTLALKGSSAMTPAKLITFIAVFSQIIPPAKNITTASFSIRKGMASIDRLNQVLDADEKIPEKENALLVTSFSDSIEFRNVWFAYNSEPVLKDISFKLKKGQTLAVVGKSGGGKSTMVDLIPRFMDVNSGSILIDGVDIRDMRLKELRSLMGIVSQQPILFNTSFRENIAFGMFSYSMDDVESAARIAHAHDFIMETEKGYDNVVGESGNKLSGGQKQRISIARAIMANPPILILDEATSALDTESERYVQDAILKVMQNRTSIVIAHRLSTIQNADYIIVIDDGRIVESGTHCDLIKIENGIYRKLHSFQTI
ncbi:MAG: ABC transporter ATP-binding protein [Bacteroidales bacterium]|jgi:subfamily B ATP-binding cassette protein MsbA